MNRKLEISQIIFVLKSHGVDYKILDGNENVGIHVNDFGDGTQWSFYGFKSLDTEDKLKSFLGY